jgi:hypothetical protein
MRDFSGRLAVRAKVKTTHRNTAALVVVDAHREVVAIHERNYGKQISKKTEGI